MMKFCEVNHIFFSGSIRQWISIWSYRIRMVFRALTYHGKRIWPEGLHHKRWAQQNGFFWESSTSYDTLDCMWSFLYCSVFFFFILFLLSALPALEYDSQLLEWVRGHSPLLWDSNAPEPSVHWLVKWIWNIWHPMFLSIYMIPTPIKKKVTSISWSYMYILKGKDIVGKDPKFSLM